MYYRQPRYFSDFHCIGGDCPDNCCYGWRIDFSKEEVDKLKSAENASPELKELIEKTFVPNAALDGKYMVQFDERGKCPLVTDDGFCRIQRELGVEFMSVTCMVYPRKYLVSKPVIYRICNSSCREIMRRLINDEKSMALVNVPIKEQTTFKPSFTTDNPDFISEHPELKYCGEFFEFFYELISDKRHNVETNIILGALAAQSLTKLIENKQYDIIPEALKSFKSQMHNASQLRAIENIKPNYALRFGFIGKLLREIESFSMINTLSDQTGTLNIDLYNASHDRLNEIFKDNPFYLRNIALNLLFEFAVPFKFKDKTVFENYSLFVVSYACIKLNLISIAITGSNGKVNFNAEGQHFHYEGNDRFVGLTSIICRHICQNETKQKAIIDRLNENGFTSPAYIALLVK